MKPSGQGPFTGTVSDEGTSRKAPVEQRIQEAPVVLELIQTPRCPLYRWGPHIDHLAGDCGVFL